MKRLLKNILLPMGYKVSKINKIKLLSDDPLIAIKQHLPEKSPIFFDVGANEGQTIRKISEKYPNSEIYAFEPSKTCFQSLEVAFKNAQVNIYNVAIGDYKGSIEFNEYSWSALNSILKRAYGTAKINSTYLVDVLTIDDFCKTNNISHINLLKTDTEGYELHVLKGASSMIKQNKIQFVLVEIFFNENYVGQSSFGDIYNFLIDNKFELVRFYDMVYTHEGLASKTDALFISSNFNT